MSPVAQDNEDEVSGAIYLVRDDGGLVEMREQPYDTEDVLQKLLADHPRLLGGDEGTGVLLVSREVAVADEEGSAGRLDHLFLDRAGVPMLVEVKRATDPRIRREVVGQLLDYAANAAVHWPVERLRASFEKRCAERGRDPAALIAEHLGDDIDPDTLWEQTKTNLQAGRIRLIFIADQIPPRLRRIVEFLNEQMDPAEVLALEVQQFVGEGVKTLVPRVVGQTAGAQQRKGAGSSEGRTWDEQSFFIDLETRRGAAEANAARAVHRWATDASRVAYGSGSFIAVIASGTGDHYLFRCRADGILEINFQYLMRKPPFDDEAKRLDMLARLNAIPGVNIAPEHINKRPPVPLVALTDAVALRQFLSVLDWAAAEIRLPSIPGGGT